MPRSSNMSMECPRCAVGLVSRRLREVDAEVCESCGGMFLEHGELNRIARPTDGDLEYSTVHEEKFLHADVHGSRSCPRCPNAPMKKVEFAIHTEIILDYCETCSGFWLDGDELQRIDETIRELDDAEGSPSATALDWLTKFIWSLPR